MRFVDTLDPVLVPPSTLRQSLGDFINTAEGEAADWGQELYSLADVKFMAGHGVNTPRRKLVYHHCGRRVSGHHGCGGGKAICVGDWDAVGVCHRGYSCVDHKTSFALVKENPALGGI